MGRPTGFLNNPRATPLHATPMKDFRLLEFHGHLPRRACASRARVAWIAACLLPHRHSGRRADHWVPLHNLIRMNDLIYKDGCGKPSTGYTDQQFSEFTGRVCPAPCRDLACSHQRAAGDHQGQRVPIIDRGFDEGWVVAQPPTQRTGKTVAWWAPARRGLACADELNPRRAPGHGL